MLLPMTVGLSARAKKLFTRQIFFHHEHLKMQMVCHDLTNFGRSGQIFERSADKFAPIV